MRMKLAAPELTELSHLWAAGLFPVSLPPGRRGGRLARVVRMWGPWLVRVSCVPVAWLTVTRSPMRSGSQAMWGGSRGLSRYNTCLPCLGHQATLNLGHLAPDLDNTTAFCFTELPLTRRNIYNAVCHPVAVTLYNPLGD